MSGERRQPVRMVVSDFAYRGKVMKGVRFVSGDKSLILSGEDGRVDCNNPIGFCSPTIYSGNEPLATLRLLKGWSHKPEAGDEITVDEKAGTAVWRRPWKTKDGAERVFSYAVSGDADGHVYVDYDFGVTEDEAKALGGLPFVSSVELFGNGCLTRTYGMGRTVHAPRDPAFLATREPPYHQVSTPVEEKSDTFFYEPDNEARRFTLTLPTGMGRGAAWYEGLEQFGTANERPKLHLRYFDFCDFKKPGSSAKVRGRFTIDFCKSSTRLQAGEPPTGGVDFWGADAIHVPVPPTRNLMQNGSFEQNWKGWRWAWGGATYRRVPRDQEHYGIVDGGMDGGKALIVRRSQAGVVQLNSASVPTVAGKKYTLSWYAKAKDRKSNVAVKFCSAGRGGRYGWLRKGHDYYTPALDWERRSVTFEADSAGIYVMIYGDGEVMLDRFMLEEGDKATDYTEDPLLARLVTSNPDNDIRLGDRVDARLELQSLSGASGQMRVRVKNYFSEVLFDRTFDVKGGDTIPLDLDEKALGVGVFVVRMDFETHGANGRDARSTRSWTDYRRFCVSKPLANTHPTATFFCGMPWFARMERGADVARKMKEWGLGAIGCQSGGNGIYVRNRDTAELCREHNIRMTLHPVAYEQDWRQHKAYHGLSVTNLTDRYLADLEDFAYRQATNCAPDDTLWTFFNEEESMARRIGFDNHFKLVQACYRGCRRAFDERGLKLRFAPTHGVSHYFHGRNYDAIDGYLGEANRHGFKYDAVTVHSYQNVDGSVLGPKDADVETQHLVERMKFYGYPDETPILLSESFNMLPYYVPAWGATDWSDGSVCGAPSEDLGNREFLHAAAMARLFLLGLKFYPKVVQVNPWQFAPGFIDHDLQPYAWLKMVNTLGHLFPDPRHYGDARPYSTVRGHVFLQDERAILAVWTTDNEVERGRKRGQTLEMDLPADVTFVDLMGNERKAKVKGEGERLICPVPLTPAPLFVIGRKDQAEALLTAVKTALTDDPSQAIAAEIRPEADGSVVLEVENTTSRVQVAGLGGGRGLELAANGRKTEKLAEVSVEPLKTYAFTTNYPFLAGPWKMNWFYVPKCGARPDWTSLPSLPIANEVRRSAAKPVTMKASFKMAWNESRLYLRVEAGDDKALPEADYGTIDPLRLYLYDGCLEVYFDGFADARRQSVQGFDLNDSRYDFVYGKTHRQLAVNWQLAQGTQSATDQEVAEKLEQRCFKTEKGVAYEIAFAPRYLAPIRLQPGTRASLGLFIHDRDSLTDKGENGLSLATERGKVCNRNPHLWPEFILLP